MVAANPLSRVLKQRSGVALIASSIILIVVAIIALFVPAGTPPPSGGPLLDSATKLSSTAAEAARRGQPPVVAALQGQIDTVLSAQSAAGAAGGRVSTLISSIKSDGAALAAARSGFDASQAALKSLSDGVPQLMRSTQQVAERLATRNGSPGQIYLAAGQMIRLERMRAAINSITFGSGDARAAANQLDTESKGFAQNQKVLIDSLSDLHDGQFDSLMQAIATQFGDVAAAIANLIQSADGLAQTRASLDDLAGHTASLVQSIADDPAATPVEASLPIPTLIAVLAGGLAALLLVSFVVMAAKNVQEDEVSAEESDAQQQQAILNLLDEITKLANGDLTVDVTVTEDFTGAIADSINYTVQTLRGLVGTINESSAELASAAASTLTVVRQMNVDSESQAREISNVASNISMTSDSLQSVAASALGLAAQAQASVQTAHDGAATVGRTIQNMAALREQIQDTAKRIKRLGESSQEIGNIIEFINDISEQTNTLALNASIQAAMAGESGRGFAVVADEVQRLAERASSATRQIENLIKTIQADTTEAIISMERSTANVVSGAKSAEEAGQSLTKIEAASLELSGLIQNISGAARDQSTQTTTIAQNMQAIREITMQTANSAETTAQAVSDLNMLSDKLRESVAGFKLPTEALGHDPGHDLEHDAI